MDDIRSCDVEEMIQIARGAGEKPFRGKQLFGWVHGRQTADFFEMSNLPAGFREWLKNKYALPGMETVRSQVSRDGSTAKYLFSLSDGNLVESVWMKYRHGNSVCVSSQAGCRMGCAFCASTQNGLARNLTAGEMLSQIYEIQRVCGERISHVIVMGMGEPLDNYENLLKFIRLLSCDGGICISQRNITVSTCGLTDKIAELMREKLQITLAISLHAPNDEVRRALMPVAARYPVDGIFDACRSYFAATGRRITFEYSMIRGVNDRKAHAEELAERCRGLNCHVNLIPLNEVRESPYARSEEKDIRQFQYILEKNGIQVTKRREMGSDIDAACGQLRKKFL